MTQWACDECGQVYPCIQGIPKLYSEVALGEQDRALRDYFYNGILGTYYRFIMPFLSLPARPFRLSWREWLAYFSIIAGIGALLAHSLHVLRALPELQRPVLDYAVLAATVVALGFLLKHRYLLSLIILAVPVRLALLFARFRPDETFAAVHARIIKRLQDRTGKLSVLDVSTGTCNSLYRHGWMALDADYIGLDLSETMLLQGRDLMTGYRVPMDFVVGDAAQLPFESETFDLVLNYGAINAMTDPGRALAEMSRVCKPGGVILFLDEQLYKSASRLERAYFYSVLSSHNVVHRCPVELLPEGLDQVEIRQVYHFYYICTAVKS